MMNNEIKFLSITAINKYLAYKFEMDANLQEVYLQGEISNFKYSGKHCYFSLKDTGSEISAMFFYPNNLNLSFKPVDGMSVQVVGKIQVYQKKGTYAIIVQKMAQAGIGLLYQEFLDLKEKLQKEGLFDENKKLKLPEFPEKVAVITASTGEAIQDIVSTFNRRFPLTKIALYPALVQGKDAPNDLIRALNLVYRDHDADAIIIGRGGGSFEDLSCFNDERLARLLFASPIPTISAVGHEGDYTICDFVASYRAPTPTGAAMKLTKDKEDVLDILIGYSRTLRSSITNKLKHDFQNWQHLSNSYGLNDFEKVIGPKVNQYEQLHLRLLQQSPEKIVSRLESRLENDTMRLEHTLKTLIKNVSHQYEKIAIRFTQEMMQKRIDDGEKDIDMLTNRLMHSYENNVERFLTCFQRKTDKLVILNPFHMMDKGYSMVYKEEKLVSSVRDIEINEQIDVRFSDGTLKAVVQKISYEEKEKHKIWKEKHLNNC